MIHEINVNALCRILEKAYDCKTCTIESIGILAKSGGMENIRIGSGGMLDLHIDLNDQ